jgi:mannosyltransferase OCH1-like enzyme
VIPRLFHQIWLGPEPFPPEYAAFQETWRRLHPEWELRFWREGSLPAGLRPEVYELLRQPAERADILRLELLNREGGIYIDADLECLRPIDPLLDGVSFFLGALDSGRVSNAIIGSVPGHPLLVRALAELRPRSTYGPVDREGTGPLLLERLRGEFPDVRVFEPQVLYETSRERAVYTFHHSARSWKDASALREDVVRAERDRATARAELSRVQKQHELAKRELEALREGRTLRAAALWLSRRTAGRFRRGLRRLLRAPRSAPLQ